MTPADASGATLPADHARTHGDAKACAQCGSTFVPRKRWAKFCSAKCRTAHHAGDDGLRAVVSKVTVMRRGKVSVVLHFDLEDRDRAAALTPGDVIEVLRS